VFTGAHGLANGLDALLDAAGELKRRFVTGVRFVLIGEGGQRKQLMERSRREGLDPWVTWVDRIPKTELARLLPRFDVGLMILKNLPAFYYGTSPNKFFDYIAGGLPVLNNYPGWLAEMITQHQCGMTVAPDDPAAFADRVLWLREHRDDRREMGRRARRLAESEFSRSVLGSRLVSLLEQVHADSERGRHGGC
jgi:glycosyltransferase involved in cell wall biosynthesis